MGRVVASASGPPRRQFLKTVGAGLAGLAASAVDRAGVASPALRVIDFHNHFVGSAFAPMAGRGAPAARRAHFDAVNRNLASAPALVDSIAASGVAARVINTPLEFIQDPEGDTSGDTVTRINDQLAELVGRHPGRLHGLATVDVFSGEAGAREVVRAVRELGLRGVFAQAAKKDLLLDAPQARPALAAAASLGVPVFVHPITDPRLATRLRRYGRPGVTLNRGTINAAALVALLEGGTLDELPQLRIVVTTLAIGAILLVANLHGDKRLRRDAPETARRHVYIDTMGLDPVLIRAAVDTLGADHVIAGTDWPIFLEPRVPERLLQALDAAGLNAEEQQLVAAGNAARLLGIA